MSEKDEDEKMTETKRGSWVPRFKYPTASRLQAKEKESKKLRESSKGELGSKNPGSSLGNLEQVISLHPIMSLFLHVWDRKHLLVGSLWKWNSHAQNSAWPRGSTQVSALNILLVSMGCLIEKEWNNAICSNMDGPKDSPPEWSKSDREGEIS